MNTELSIFDNPEEKFVRRIATEEAMPFLMNIHYARRKPCITDAFGLFVGGDLVGVVTYGIPASMHLCIGIAGRQNQYNVKESNRLCLLPNYNASGGGRNYASYLVSHSLKMLDHYTFVVSYADSAWTHVGYIYQACNFLYTGMSAKRTDTYQPEGKHPRSYSHALDNSMRQTRSAKHRYIYLVGSKREKKKMRAEMLYPVLPYPKGDERQYDISDPHPEEEIKVYKKGENNGNHT